MGVQVIGRPRDDLSVLQLTHLYEQIAPWMTKAPPAAHISTGK
jgi:amidase